MRKFILLKEEDDTAIGVIHQENPPGVLPGTYAIEELDQAAFDNIKNFICDYKEFGKKSLKYKNEKLDFTDRDEVPCSINKTSIVADGTDELVISGLPKKTTVSLGPGVEWKIKDSVFIFTAIVPNDYTFTISAPDFKDKTVTITAVRV